MPVASISYFISHICTHLPIDHLRSSTMAQGSGNFILPDDPEINPNPQNLATALIVIGWTAHKYVPEPETFKNTDFGSQLFLVLSLVGVLFHKARLCQNIALIWSTAYLMVLHWPIRHTGPMFLSLPALCVGGDILATPSAAHSIPTNLLI